MHSSSKKEILEHRWRKDRGTLAVGERFGDRSITQPGYSWFAHSMKDDEDTPLPGEWLRYLEYMNVIAEELSPTDKGAAFKNLALEDARSRREAQPPPIPGELGTPAEFKERLAGHELEIRTRFNRREQVIAIRVYQLPPDEYEDLDPSEEPPGHWEGLKWISAPE